jgi:hypothetical protein
MLPQFKSGGMYLQKKVCKKQLEVSHATLSVGHIGTVFIFRLQRIEGCRQCGNEGARG